MMIDASPTLLFATPIVTGQTLLTHDELTAIRTYLLLRHRMSPSELMVEDLFNDTQTVSLCPELFKAKEEFLALFEQLYVVHHPRGSVEIKLVSCKYNIMRPGERRPMHMHVKTDAYALLYLDDVQEGKGGELVLHDPKFTDSVFTPANFHLVRPSRGTLIAAPSHVWHEVNPYFGVAERVALVVNCNIVD